MSKEKEVQGRPFPDENLFEIILGVEAGRILRPYPSEDILGELFEDELLKEELKSHGQSSPEKN